jgi:hypothetical protein
MFPPRKEITGLYRSGLPREGADRREREQAELDTAAGQVRHGLVALE